MSHDNPYQAPRTESAPAKNPPARSAWRMTVGILLLVGMAPASAAAFFCCCYAGVAATEGPGGRELDSAITTGLVAGSVGGLLAFGLMLWGGIAMLRRSKRTINP